MSENLKQQFPKLELLSKIKQKKLRQTLLRVLSKDEAFCKAVREITKNTLKRNIKLSDREKKRLFRYRKTILALVHKSNNNLIQRRAICQTGTGIFLPIVVPLVADLLYNILKPKS